MFKKDFFNKNQFIEKYMIYFIPSIFFIINVMIIGYFSYFKLVGINILHYHFDSVIQSSIIKEGSLAVSGFTITIVSVFGIGVSTSTIKISEKQKSNDLYRYILLTFITAILLYLLSNIHMSNKSIIIKLIYICYILFTLLVALRFTIIVFAMFKSNLYGIGEEIKKEKNREDVERKFRNEILIYLKLISETETLKQSKKDLDQKKEILSKRDKKYNKKK